MISPESLKDFGEIYLFEAQLGRGNLSRFQCFDEFCTGLTEYVNLEFQKKFIHDLNMHLDRIVILLFLNPFNCTIDDVPVKLVGVTDLQGNDFLKESQREGKLGELYHC